MSFNAKQKKMIAGKIVDILELMLPEQEEFEEEELEEEELEEEEEPEEEEEKPARSSKKKAATKEKASTKKGKASSKKKAAEAPTLNAVRKAMRAFSTEYGQAEAKALLEPYDAKSLSALDESDYQSLLDDIEAYND